MPPPLRHPRPITSAGRGRWPFAATVALVALAAFATTLFIVSPSPPRAAISAYIETRTTDQHYSGCDAVRAAGRQDIPSWDPSYRSWMDGDGDGRACEPPRY